MKWNYGISLVSVYNLEWNEQKATCCLYSYDCESQKGGKMGCENYEFVKMYLNIKLMN